MCNPTLIFRDKIDKKSSDESIRSDDYSDQTDVREEYVSVSIGHISSSNENPSRDLIEFMDELEEREGRQRKRKMKHFNKLTQISDSEDDETNVPQKHLQTTKSREDVDIGKVETNFSQKHSSKKKAKEENNDKGDSLKVVKSNVET